MFVSARTSFLANHNCSLPIINKPPRQFSAGRLPSPKRKLFLVAPASLTDPSADTTDADPEVSCLCMDSMRTARPLVQCITNFVSMDLMANTLLAAGASPAMVSSTDEVEEFMDVASALVVNVGTLSSDWVSAMKLSIHRANSLGKPWVLDPVAAGATTFRTKVCTDILSLGPTVLRGNASEIIALAGADGKTRGVDSTVSSDSALEAAHEIARRHNCIVAVTGEVDYVTNGSRVASVRNGVPMLCAITATGCSVTALIAAFVAANPERPLAATAAALSMFGVAAENASKQADGPGSLRVSLLDSLHSLSGTELQQQCAVSTEKLQ